MPDTRDVALIAPIADERRRMLENQVAFTDTLRNRTTAMLSVAAIVAGLFGTRLATGSQPKPALAAIAAALLLFALSALLSIRIMMLKDMSVGVETTELMQIKEGKSSPYRVCYTLAKKYQEAYDANATVIERLNRYYTWTCALVGAQVIAWALSIRF